MRPQPLLRARRPLAALGVATLAAGASAVAQAQDNQDVIQAKLADTSVAHGQRATLTGRVPEAGAGVPVALQFRATGAEATWRTLSTGTTREGGRFRVSGRPPRSGEVRVVAAGTGNAGASPTARAASTGSGGTSSNARAVAVSASFKTRRVRADVLKGRAARVRGVLQPAQAGRTVALQARRGGKWRTIARDATDASGAYALKYKTKRTGSWPLRVRFGGDDAHAPARRRVGRLDVYRRSYASWYGPGLYGGKLACGGTLSAGTVGVAHKSLPCGTKVTFRYKGRSVRVPVVDRGPYVGGREYDLTSATKDRLGFKGHGTVWSTK